MISTISLGVHVVPKNVAITVVLGMKQGQIEYLTIDKITGISVTQIAERMALLKKT